MPALAIRPVNSPPSPPTDARRARLDAHGAQLHDVILARQDPATGLLPASTAVTVHGDYTHAWVRDNVYSILGVWALSAAYRRHDADRAAALADRVTQLMRGLLAAMMKQAHKVEAFKRTNNPLDALHAKYDTRTGDAVVGDDEWGHLQLDATALFVLFVAQMRAAGLTIVRTPDEAAFVQNLVHYLARAWRTPDFGIWERGHKRNEGVAEINASSVGMAKAALEAIAGCRLLPGGPAIHVVADDIARSRDALAGLPCESQSKETDAALLSVIGFPAFAVDDADLAARTRAEIIGKLQGRYGCKRFLRDGHQTVLEDSGRLHYEPGELREFEHVESEWPLFDTYLLIDAALQGDTAQAADYRRRLESLMVERDGRRLLPELYFVPAAAIDAERADPHSQQRLPNENVPLVWAHSLYAVGVLLQEGWIDGADLDPLGRRLRRGARAEVCLQVALLAADPLVQARLAAQGIAAETLAEAAAGPAPIRVAAARELIELYRELGRCDALGLSGRPPFALGSLATSGAYTLGAQRLVFVPACFERRGFYLALDNRLLVDEIQAEMSYIRRHWATAGDPLLVLPITGSMLDAQGADVLLDFLQSLAQSDPASLCVGRLGALWSRAAVTEIDWVEGLPAEAAAPPPSPALGALLQWEEAATRPLTAERSAALEREPHAEGLMRLFAASRNPYEQAAVLELLWRRHGGGLPMAAGLDVAQMTEAFYARACRQRAWGVLRRAAGLLDRHDDALEEAVAQLVLRHKRVLVGRYAVPDAVIARPLGTAEIVALLRSHGGDDARARVLIEEALLLLGTLIKADPALFEGTLTVRGWHLVQLIIGWLEREHGATPAEAFEHLLGLSPRAILDRLREVIAHEREMTDNLQQQRSLHGSVGAERLVRVRLAASADPRRTDGGDGDGDGWHRWRELRGVMTRVGGDFYARVWNLFAHCGGLVIGDPLDARNTLDGAVLRADTTPAERAFAAQVDDLLNKIGDSAYRQLSIEALLAVSSLCRANPRLRIDGMLVVDVLLGAAVRLNWVHATAANRDAADPFEAVDDVDEVAAAWQLFYASEPHRVANFVTEAFARLLQRRTD